MIRKYRSQVDVSVQNPHLLIRYTGVSPPTYPLSTCSSRFPQMEGGGVPWDPGKQNQSSFINNVGVGEWSWALVNVVLKIYKHGLKIMIGVDLGKKGRE